MSKIKKALKTAGIIGGSAAVGIAADRNSKPDGFHTSLKLPGKKTESVHVGTDGKISNNDNFIDEKKKFIKGTISKGKSESNDIKNSIKKTIDDKKDNVDDAVDRKVKLFKNIHKAVKNELENH